jgi:TRAP-type C4-dicarboxylate transport system permease small subunit
MRVIDRLLKWLEIPINLLLWVGLLAGFLMMMHVTADVTGRTIFNHPLSGTTEIIAGWYMVAAAYLPWAYISRTDGHITVDMFTRLASPRFLAVLEILIKLLTIVWVSVFTYQTFIRAVQQTRAGEVWEAAGGFILIWPSRWMLPLSGGLMVLYLILRVMSDIGHHRKGRAKAGRVEEI